jgi:hypothetical protein
MKQKVPGKISPVGISVKVKFIALMAQKYSGFGAVRWTRFRAFRFL